MAEMNKRTQAVLQKTKVGELMIVKAESILMSLPRHLRSDFDRYLLSANIAVSANKDLEKCSKESILTSIVAGAELGLPFTKEYGYAYLVPFKGKCTFMPGYKGLIHLAKKSGEVKKIQTFLVYNQEVEAGKFSIRGGDDAGIEHDLLTQLTNNYADKDLFGVYAVAELTNGATQFEFMTKKQLDGIKARSKAKSGPWITDYLEMCRKTVVRRICKYFDMTGDLAKAIEADNEAVGFVEIDHEVVDPKKTGTAEDRVGSMLDGPDEAVDTETGEVHHVDDKPLPDAKPEEADPPELNHEDPIGRLCDAMQEKKITVHDINEAAKKVGVKFSTPQALSLVEADAILTALKI